MIDAHHYKFSWRLAAGCSSGFSVNGLRGDKRERVSVALH
jgi:hypothetical protein